MTISMVADWPGKSADDRGVEHPALYHMLDVAAVAELLCPPALPAPLRAAFVLFAALHDLGKINAAFRNMLRVGQPQIAGRHWEVTEALLHLHDELLASRLSGRPRQRFQLYAACAGHHGRPPTRDLHVRNGAPVRDWKRMLDGAGSQALADSASAIQAFCDLWPDASLAGVGTSAIPALSWRLAGLITVADWIGSNPDWFPPCPAGPALPAYLAATRGRAEMAIRCAGLQTPEASTTRLFDFAPHPMQEACETIPLPDGPALAIIEDETGAGKTEAALLLAQRMLLARKAQGLYIALPTMATADAMFARVAEVLRPLFDGAPSLALAHGRAGQHTGFRSLAAARALNPDEPGPTEWLLDNRRRALLADVGVGTVDQALLAVIRARHAPLRQFGLSRKLLIVDEVHEMGDPYMGWLLETLLHVQAAQGGSAILLSATLDMPLRARLVAAFEAGAGRETSTPDSAAYPSLTVPGVASPVIPARPSARGAVAVRRMGALEDTLNHLSAAAAQGAACVFVRNAVDEAIAVHAALVARGVPADLLHARFALHDRKRHETRALALFGKARDARPGRVLVATQVVESSLDLDFDVMVSDLAPMAALMQRAGRLWRHMDRRPAASRPCPGPHLHILSPDPAEVENDRWAQTVLGQGGFVYPASLLWRTARVLFDTGEIRAPEGLRDLIEAAHGDVLPVPAPLERAELAQLGRDGAAKTHAGMNAIDWASGYRSGASGAGDADYPTRLGVPQRVLVLMRDGAPWSGGDWSVDSCQLSEVQASAARIDRLALPESAPPRGLPEWLVLSRHFVRVGDDGVICEGLSYDPSAGLCFS